MKKKSAYQNGIRNAIFFTLCLGFFWASPQCVFPTTDLQIFSATSSAWASQENSTEQTLSDRLKQQRGEKGSSQNSGGLLRHLISGTPFTGFTVIDFLAIAAVAFIGYILFFKGISSPGDDDDGPGPGRNSEAYKRAQQTWNYMNAEPTARADSLEENTGPPQAPQSSEGDSFLQGAKMVYARVHESLGMGDIDDVASFLTTEMRQSLEARLSSFSQGGKKTILFVEAQLLELDEASPEHRATVRYKALVQQENGDGQSHEIREVWHFVKDSADKKATWLLKEMESVH